MSRLMKAMILKEPKPIEEKPLQHVELPIPEPGPGEVLVGRAPEREGRAEKPDKEEGDGQSVNRNPFRHVRQPPMAHCAVRLLSPGSGCAVRDQAA